jgi:hypothetical protein
MLLAACCWLLFDATKPVVRERPAGEPPLS